MNETTEMKGINSSEDTNSDCLRTRQGGRARMQRIGSGGDDYKGSWENLPAMGEFFILIMIMVSYMPCNVGQLYLSKYVHRMFIAALFTIAKIWKQPKCPSDDEWIKQLWYIYTMEYYSAVKRKKILPLATAWIDLENIMLSEIRQSEKDKYHMISLICGI